MICHNWAEILHMYLLQCTTDQVHVFIIMDFYELCFDRIVDTSEEYIKVIILHPNVHSFFHLFM